jgi:hypothetical protein
MNNKYKEIDLDNLCETDKYFNGLRYKYFKKLMETTDYHKNMR